jgi:hypothetical protein
VEQQMEPQVLPVPQNKTNPNLHEINVQTYFKIAWFFVLSSYDLLWQPKQKKKKDVLSLLFNE